MIRDPHSIRYPIATGPKHQVWITPEAQDVARLHEGMRWEGVRWEGVRWEKVMNPDR